MRLLLSELSECLWSDVFNTPVPFTLRRKGPLGLVSLHRGSFYSEAFIPGQVGAAPWPHMVSGNPSHKCPSIMGVPPPPHFTAETGGTAFKDLGQCLRVSLGSSWDTVFRVYVLLFPTHSHILGEELFCQLAGWVNNSPSGKFHLMAQLRAEPGVRKS